MLRIWIWNGSQMWGSRYNANQNMVNSSIASATEARNRPKMVPIARSVTQAWRLMPRSWKQWEGGNLRAVVLLSFLVSVCIEFHSACKQIPVAKRKIREGSCLYEMKQRAIPCGVGYPPRSLAEPMVSSELRPRKTGVVLAARGRKRASWLCSGVPNLSLANTISRILEGIKC